MQRKTFRNRIIDEEGRVTLSDDGIIESLYKGITDLNKLDVVNSEEVELYNKWASLYEMPLLIQQSEIDHNKNQSIWKMPDFYKQMDIEEYLYMLCSSNEQLDRVKIELQLYKDRDLYDLIRYLVYIVDVMREHNVVWGVGRGSSVSSYVLFLIGIHKIDSLLYQLDIKEFLK